MRTVPALVRVRCWLAAAAALVAAGGCAPAAQSTGPTAEVAPIRRLEMRVALVIGNAGYPASLLRQPVNNARAIATTLRTLGFDVLVLENANRADMLGAIREFGDRLRRAPTGLFYYAGYALQVSGRNYLVPVDADPKSDADVDAATVALATVIEVMPNAAHRTNVLVLDACRDHPFAGRFHGSRGLVAEVPPEGSLIAYAARPGRVAVEGDGPVSIYTAALVDAMRLPAQHVEEIFKRVRHAVRSAPERAQTPWEASALVADATFTSRTSSSAATTAPSQRPQPHAEPRQYGPEFDAWQRHFAAGLAARDVGNMPAAMAALQSAVGEARRLASKNREPLAASLNRLAWHFYAQADLERTEGTYREAFRLQETTLDPSFEFSVTLNGLGQVALAQGKFGDARAFYRHAIEVDDRVLGPKDPRRAWNLASIADLYLAFGQVPLAAEYYVRSLRATEAAFGPEHIELVDGLMSLATVAFVNGQLHQATGLFRRAIQIQEKTLGHQHCDIRRTLLRLAWVLRAANANDDARDVERRIATFDTICAASVSGTR